MVSKQKLLGNGWRWDEQEVAEQDPSAVLCWVTGNYPCFYVYEFNTLNTVVDICTTCHTTNFPEHNGDHLTVSACILIREGSLNFLQVVAILNEIYLCFPHFLQQMPRNTISIRPRLRASRHTTHQSLNQSVSAYTSIVQTLKVTGHHFPSHRVCVPLACALFVWWSVLSCLYSVTWRTYWSEMNCKGFGRKRSWRSPPFISNNLAKPHKTPSVGIADVPVGVRNKNLSSTSQDIFRFGLHPRSRGSVVGWGTLLTRRKVAGSILDNVIGFLNKANFILHCGPGVYSALTEMRSRNLPGGKVSPALKADNLNAICHLWASFLENVGASASHNRMGLHGGLLQEYSSSTIPTSSAFVVLDFRTDSTYCLIQH
jgi:hypothetical protein